MTTIKIIQEKQENGLWGTPLNCKSINILQYPFKNELKFSAIIVALSEKYLNHNLEIYQVDDDGFFVTLHFSFMDNFKRTYHIKFKDYEIIDDLLYDFTSCEIEHIRFNRRNKLKKLSKIFDS